ncbi:MAG TPA: ABC transporter permease [Candidatus Didemnitutus sp.]|nr:ABC transporter permease [Candidatus Didemnitutus sp.]
MSDLKIALRSLFKTPGFTVVAILTIAIGIGANTALFSTFNTLVLHPLSLPQSDRLVRIWASNTALNFNAPAVSWPRYQFIREHQTSFSDLAVSTFTGFAYTRDGGEPEQINSFCATASFFPTLGVQPVRGRNFTADEDIAGGPSVVIVSYEFWQTRLGARESAIGEPITLNGTSYTVVGVLPPALSNPFGNVLLFVPRVFEANGLTPQQIENGAGYLQLTARLKPGTTIEQAQSEITTLSKNYQAAFPARLDGKNDNTIRTFAEELVGNLKPTFYLLLAAVGFVLLIACANVASLFLGRLSARHKEIAVRLSLGATRGQLVRQLLTESLVFSIAAGGLGILIGWWGLAGIQQLGANQLPPNLVLHIDGTALVVMIGLSALCALLIGLVPAFQASRADVAIVLKDASRGAPGGTRGSRFRSALIVGEVMLSVVLLILSGLLLVSFVKLQRTPPGFNPRGVATAFVSIPAARYKTPAQQSDFYAQLIERLEAQPQVKSAAFSFGLPFSGFQPRFPFAVQGRPVPALPERQLANLDVVTERYFTVMQIPLRDGRLFGAQDRADAPAVCVINEGLARRLFPGESAVGKVLLRGRDAEIKYEVVGVVGDVKGAGLNSPPSDDIYFPLRQLTRAAGNVVVRTDGDPAALQAMIRSTVAALDNNQPIAIFQTLDSLVTQSLGFQRVTAQLTGVFAAVALLLSAVGLYSVLAYAVTQRTSEIGIRMALGAQKGQVVSLILSQGMKLVGIGLVAGLGAAAAGTRLIRTLLFEVEPLDPVVFGGVALLFAAVAIAACLAPSLRASRVDPLVALRAD